jgi:hypothetical protein
MSIATPSIHSGRPPGPKGTLLGGNVRQFRAGLLNVLLETAREYGPLASSRIGPRRVFLASKIRQRLGGDPGMAAPFPKKPKGMWQRTYERFRNQGFEAEMLAHETLTIQTERLRALIENPTRNRRFRR